MQGGMPVSTDLCSTAGLPNYLSEQCMYDGRGNKRNLTVSFQTTTKRKGWPETVTLGGSDFS